MKRLLLFGFRNKMALCVCFVLMQSGTMAQNVWTLEDCISHACANNILVRQQQLSVRLSKLSGDQSIAALFPSLNASATHVYNYGQTIDPYTNSFATSRVQSNNFYVSSSVTLFSGLQLLNSMKQKRLDFLASAYDLEKAKNDIALTVATAYLQVLYNMEYLEVARGQAGVTAQQVDRTKKLVEAEILTPGNLYTIEAQLSAEQYTVVQAENQLALSYLTLAQMLDFPDASGFEIAKPVVASPDASALLDAPSEIYERSLALQPDVKSAELKVQSARKGVSVAFGALSPIIALSGSWGTGYSGASKELLDFTPGDPVMIGYVEYSGVMVPVYGPTYNYIYRTKPFGDQIRANENQSIGLYVNIPIFNKWQVQTGIGSAKIGYQMSELHLQNTRLQLNKTIQQAHADAVAALKRYHAAQKSADAYQEAFSYAQKRYDQGLLSTIEYNDASNKLSASRSDLLQSKYEYLFRIKVLDFYQGKPLTLK